MTTEATEATEAHHRITPGRPNRAAWALALIRDGAIGPMALAVGLLVASLDYRRTWPRFPLSTRNVSRRLDIPENTVEAVISAFAAMGYVAETGDFDGNRRVMLAVLPDRVAVSADQNTSD